MAGKILVLGANGTIGSKVVQALVVRGETVKAASRKATAVDGAEAVAFDYEDAASFGPALEGVDRLFVLTPGVTSTHWAFLARSLQRLRRAASRSC